MTEQITCKRCGKRFWAGQGGDTDGEDLCEACHEKQTSVDITVAGGKYTMRKLEDGAWTALRYGEAWPAFKDVGPDNLHVALTIEIIELRKQLEVLQNPETINEPPTIVWNTNVGRSAFGDVYRIIYILSQGSYILHRNGVRLISDWTGTFDEAKEAAQEDVNRIYRSRQTTMKDAIG